MRLYSTMQISTALQETLNAMEKAGEDIKEIGKAEMLFTRFYRQYLLTSIPAAED